MTRDDTARPSPAHDARSPLAALRSARERDPIGHRVHLGLAAAYAFALPVATAPEGIAGAALLVYSIMRLHRTWRSYALLAQRPVLWALVAWVAWSAASIAWSSDPAQGWDEMQAARAVLVPLMVWPVLDGAAVIVVAALLGVLAANGIQAAQYLELFGLAPDSNGRLAGKLHAGNTAAWCTAALCWHVSAALHGRGLVRWSALLLAAVAAAGLIASGSRGPWIAAAIAVPAALVVIAIRRPATRRFAAVLAAIGVIGAAVAWPVARDVIVPRVERAADEVRRALDDRDYSTSAGLRVAMWHWAGAIFLESPVAGCGAGGYQDELYEQASYRTLLARQRNDEDIDFLTRDHPHSTYLYTLARTGAVGGTLLAMTLLLAGARAWRMGGAAPAHPWADGTLFALVSWIVGAPIDCYELNATTFGMLTLIIAVTLGVREEDDAC